MSSIFWTNRGLVFLTAVSECLLLNEAISFFILWNSSMKLASVGSFLGLLLRCLVFLALGEASIRVVFFAYICFAIFPKVIFYQRLLSLILPDEFDMLV